MLRRGPRSDTQTGHEHKLYGNLCRQSGSWKLKHPHRIGCGCGHRMTPHKVRAPHATRGPHRVRAPHALRAPQRLRAPDRLRAPIRLQPRHGLRWNLPGLPFGSCVWACRPHSWPTPMLGWWWSRHGAGGSAHRLGGAARGVFGSAASCPRGLPPSMGPGRPLMGSPAHNAGGAAHGVGGAALVWSAEPPVAFADLPMGLGGPPKGPPWGWRNRPGGRWHRLWGWRSRQWHWLPMGVVDPPIRHMGI